MNGVAQNHQCEVGISYFSCINIIIFLAFVYSWSTNDLHGRGRLVLNNTGMKSINVHVGVRQGAFDAHGGVIGGYMEVQDIVATGIFLLIL